MGGDNRGKKALVCCALALISVYTLVELGQFRSLRYFHAPSDVEAKISTDNGRNGTSSFFRKHVDHAVPDEKVEAALKSPENDWNHYWSYATRRGKGTADDEEAHRHDDGYVASQVEAVTDAALQHIDDMRSRYESVNALADFYARGLGWIQDRLDMVLAVVVAGNFSDNSTADNIALHAGPSSIFIVDTTGKVKCGGREGLWKENHPPLTMWVRANGPEIFAGTAMPHLLKPSSSGENHRCAWRYIIEPKRAGVYSIHVKVLTFNGFVDTLSGGCKTEKIPSRNDQFDHQKTNKSIEGSLKKLEAINSEVVIELAEQGNFTHHRGVSGFKMYSVIDACCEACTRARNCKMWSTPGGRHYDNCELYFNRLEDDVDFLGRSDGHYLGRDRNYSYTKQQPGDFPAFRRRLSFQDGKTISRRLAVSPDEIAKPWPIADPPSKGLPWAGAATPYYIGCGWSALLSFESPCHYPSDDVVFRSGQKISIRQRSVSNILQVKGPTRSCLLDDEKLDVSNGRWVRYPYPNDLVCSAMVRDNRDATFRDFRPLYNGDLPPYCWYREDLTKIATGCAEPGCQWVIKHRWMTDLKRESKWFGMWEPRECGYRLIGDEDIQQCIDQKKISKIEVRGASISTIVKGYVSQRLQSINMTGGGSDGSRVVVLDTLKMPHSLWRNSKDEHRTHLENNFPNVTESEEDHYWITGFYYTSEREPHVLIDRSLQFSKMAWDILTPKGYKMINGFDVTAAFAFDTDGQADGLHINGPPVKAIVTKFFHHLCHDKTLLP